MKVRALEPKENSALWYKHGEQCVVACYRRQPGLAVARRIGGCVKARVTLLPAGRPEKPVEPDWNHVFTEMRRKGVTLQLLWIEYKRENSGGYQYSQFCQRYRQWEKSLNVTIHQEHRASEKMFVDCAGKTMKVVDPETGEILEAQIFVAVLVSASIVKSPIT